MLGFACKDVDGALKNTITDGVDIRTTEHGEGKEKGGEEE